MAKERRERKTRQARVSQSLIDGYREQVDRQGDAAADYMDKAIATYVGKYPDASTAQIRKFTYETMQAALPNFTDLAETLSCEFMSNLAEKYGWDDVNPVITGSTDYKLVDRKLHYLADLLNEGDLDGFKRSVTDVTKFYVKRSAQENMIRNCIDASVRYARVPSGFETCSFCFMLASRGFVYGDEEKAGATHKFHPDCDCIVVPGAYGRTKIDGYDPDGMYGRWKSCEKTIGGSKQAKVEWEALDEAKRNEYIERAEGDKSDAFRDFERNRIKNEVAKRDWHWLYTGKAPKGRYDPEWADYEKDTAVLLGSNGFAVDYIERSNAERRPDFYLNGVKWEMKNPENKGYMPVWNQFKTAVFGHGKSKVRNPQSDRLVISGNRSGMTLDEMENHVIEVSNDFKDTFPEIVEVLLVTEDGVRRIKR